jgi:predicted O-methyltransferase YrrM
MKKTEKIKLFLNNPFKVINSGLTIQKEAYFQERNEKNHGIGQLPTIDICELLPKFGESISNYTYLDGTSLVIDIMLLKSLARGFRNCAYLEIGSWRGESISNIYEVTGDCTSVTLSETEMKNKGISDEFIKAHGMFTRNLKGLKTIGQDSGKFDFSSLDKKFDLIFIDGDHSYEGVLNDTVKTFPIRKNSDSIIVWHDYGSSTELVRHSVLAAILDGIPREYHRNLYHVSNTLCAVYIENKAFNTYYTKFPSIPDKVFSISLAAKKLTPDFGIQT